MSTPDNSHFGQILPVVPYPPTFSSDKAGPITIGEAVQRLRSPATLTIFDGSAEDMAAMVRDAKRFRKLERLTFGQSHMIGMSKDGHDKILAWGEGRTLAEIADALPDTKP